MLVLLLMFLMLLCPGISIDAEAMVEPAGGCVAVISAAPVPVLMVDYHWGEWRVYVANLPTGDLPVYDDVDGWPVMVPGTCDMMGSCLWIATFERDDCPVVVVDSSFVGWSGGLTSASWCGIICTDGGS